MLSAAFSVAGGLQPVRGGTVAPPHGGALHAGRLVVWSDSSHTGIAEGEVHFTHGLRLRMREELDFEAGLITSYGYEVYRDAEARQIHMRLTL